MDERIARIGARLAGRESSRAGATGANKMATHRLQRARDQWGNPVPVALDSRGSSLLYSGTSVPILALPIVAWLRRTVGRAARP